MYSPLYRLEQEFNRQGLKLSRQTMSNWLLNASDTWLQPIYEVLHRQLCSEKVLHGDETTLQVLREPGRSSTSKSYMWLYRTSGCAEHPVVLYEYQPNRKAEHAEEFLKTSPAGSTRMDTRVTTGCGRISGWLAAGPTRGENLMKRCKRCPRRSEKILWQRPASATAQGCSSWKSLLRS